MLRATWRSVFARKLRLFLSAFAVILGVAFVAGSYIFTDTLDRAFTGLTSGAVGDVIVTPGEVGRRGAGSARPPPGLRTVPGDLVAELAAVPGAARADGRITNFGTFVVSKAGKIIGGQGPAGIAVNRTDGPAANGTPSATLVAGRWPAADDEVLLDESTADKAGYLLGERVGLVTATEQARIDATYVGTAEFAGSALVGASVVMFDTPRAQELYLGGEDAYSAIWVTAAPGTSQEDLRAWWPRRCPRATRRRPATPPRPERQPDRRGAVVRHDVPPRLRRSRADGRGVPHRQHVLDPRRAAQPGARPAARHRGEPAAGGQVGARSRRGSSAFSAPPSASVSASCSPIGIRLLFGRIGLDLSANELVLRAPHRRRLARRRARSSPWRPPTCRRGGPAGCRRSRRCGTTSLSPRAACAGASSSAAAPRRRDRRHGPRPCGRRLGAHLRPRRRHLRRPRRDRAAQPRARPTGSLGTRLGLPPRVRHRGPHGRAERAAEPPPDGRHGIRPHDRCRAGDDDGRARRVGQGEPGPDARRGHRRRLRRGQCRGAGVLGDDRVRRRRASRGRRGGEDQGGRPRDRRGP